MHTIAESTGGKVEHSYVEQFLEECFEPETKEYLQAVMAHISAEMDHIREDVLSSFNRFFLVIAEKQKKEPVSVAFMNMSFLYTSVYFKQPEFSLEAYDSNWYWGTSIAEDRVKADWLYAGWEEYVERLRIHIKKRGWERYIREGKLQQILLQTVKTLVIQASLTV